MLNSVWDNTKMPQFSPLSGDTETDVLIVGGGIAGLLCGYRLKEAGVDHLLIEADRICRGVTRNTTAKITSQHGLIYNKLIKRFGATAARRYYDANQAAIEQFRRMAKDTNCHLDEADSFVYSLSSEEKIEEELRALRRLNIPAEFTRKTELPFEVAGAIKFPHQAQFDPLDFLSRIARRVNICEQTKALEFIGNTVITSRGRIKAKKIVIATHFPLINKHGGYFIKMHQSRSYALALSNAPKVRGMYLGEEENGLSFRSYGDLLIITGGERVGKGAFGWSALEDFVKKYYPQAKEKARWATQDCMTLDQLPYIGRYGRATPDLYVITGFNKWGMTNSVTAAEVITNEILGRPDGLAPLFDPHRSILHPRLFVNGAKTVANLLRPTLPRCPHLGCALKWNSQERSWDCPCHGSRFDEKGRLLDNPATDDIKL